ncbi:hypothetical protein [Nocardioides nitrophenolicus]|uniref:hypothetical protein n=1 Tax=Nocardioides nitrophenolicus TaxID=60489 RepID=UPI00195AB54B|nr:hypothetical protein [Nocardioides nitrophenolicus]MBM7519113.1 hypothetical protein [Nocardioides nitrophenolicus]
MAVVGVNAPPAAAAPPFDCTTVYSEKGQTAPFDIRRVNTTTGALTTAGAFAAAGGILNGLGFTGDGRAAYSVRYLASGANAGLAIYRWDAATETTSTPLSGQSSVFNSTPTHGAVNPRTGIYYFAGVIPNTTNMAIYGYDPASNSFLGQVAQSTASAARAGPTATSPSTVPGGPTCRSAPRRRAGSS